MKKFSIKNVAVVIVPCILFAAVMMWFILTLGSTSRSADQRELNAVKATLENGITMCYAVEGVYPPNLEHLKENYGVTYNNDKYIVHYNRFADNIRPTVTVLERSV